ncbi:hypothetical protein GGE12_001228 [Rhizobium mongolense]|uniref:Uncharacterized protein n=1 Tax=Rhizobium mongolense TaxID=57676 RepID=A0A7W6RJA3_9HYPH|nr:hypothetical protein [Rhizobium mongolense]
MTDLVADGEQAVEGRAVLPPSVPAEDELLEVVVEVSARTPWKTPIIQRFISENTRCMRLNQRCAGSFPTTFEECFRPGIPW